MHGDSAARFITRTPPRPRRPWAMTPQPEELRHHALLRDLQPATLTWAVRELHRRLYDGNLIDHGDIRAIALRQGFPAPWCALLLALGWILLATALVTGSDLGRGFQLPDGGGSSTHAAAPVPFDAGGLDPRVLAAAGLGLLGMAALLAVCTRRHFSLVAQRHGEGWDVWIAGTSWRRRESFAREFAEFVLRVAAYDRAARTAAATTARKRQPA